MNESKAPFIPMGLFQKYRPTSRFKKPWIRVRDYLPPPGLTVIAVFANSLGNRRQIMASYIPRFHLESDGEEDAFDEYNEAKDKYFYCEGWYEQIENWGDFSSVHVCEGEVFAWMPRPEFPEKEGE